MGAACAAVVVALRRRLRDRVLESALAVITPFATYLPAQSLGVSGVVAVVTCGLIGSQAPKVISAGARVQITGFREVIAVRLLWLYSVPYLSKPYVRAAGPRDRDDSRRWWRSVGLLPSARRPLATPCVCRQKPGCGH
ncbi:cation:proton antiporter [Streptomyces sp. NPDC001621]|uniref:cation:proton antiporter domain-containing protein n=1 Tax=Streptomyces sp. NPDC001621 TaxID=3364594 RepID=UPI00367FC5C9